AREELRWLLEGCRDLLAAHRLLGEIALEEGDAKLARAHFGYAFQLGVDALAQAGDPGPLLYQRPANQGFFQAGKGLAWSFQQLGQPDKAREIAERLLALDPADALNFRTMLASIDSTPRQPPGG
ncbi:MAG: tetratricopeptide repeat protein, partial [Planctomycetia bacterium]|nr:tetratricopeptide repeat protein [Planctomycetia bacterium]